MKHTLLALLLLLSGTGPSVFAQSGPPAWAGQGRHLTEAGTEASEDLVALDRFLTMNDAQLDQLQKAIEKVRSMTPTQRAVLKKQMLEYRKLPAEQRDQIRAGWGWQSEADRNDWPVMMRSKPEADRARVQAEIQALPPESRAAHKHDLLEQWRQLGAR